MKRVLLTSIILFIFGCRGIPTPPEEPEYSGLYFLPKMVEINSGESKQLKLAISEAGLEFFGVTIAVEFDPTLLSFSDEYGLNFGTLLGQESIQFVQTDSNKIYITFSRTQGQDPVPADGLLGQLEFQAINPGETQVEFIQEYIFFYGANGNEIVVESLLLTPVQIQIN